MQAFGPAAVAYEAVYTTKENLALTFSPRFNGFKFVALIKHT